MFSNNSGQVSIILSITDKDEVQKLSIVSEGEQSALRLTGNTFILHLHTNTFGERGRLKLPVSLVFTTTDQYVGLSALYYFLLLHMDTHTKNIVS